jgi:hypothetical protein
VCISYVTCIYVVDSYFRYEISQGNCQVMGLRKSPSFPSDIEDACNWYERVCDSVLNSFEKKIIDIDCFSVPSLLYLQLIPGPVMKPKNIRRHGTIITIGIVSSTQ